MYSQVEAQTETRQYGPTPPQPNKLSQQLAPGPGWWQPAWSRKGTKPAISSTLEMKLSVSNPWPYPGIYYLPEQTLQGNETQPLSAMQFVSPQANPRTSSTSPSLQQKPSGPHAPDLNPPPHPNPPHYPTTQPKPPDTPPLAPPNLGPSISRPIHPPPTRVRPAPYDPTPIPPGVYTL